MSALPEISVKDGNACLQSGQAAISESEKAQSCSLCKGLTFEHDTKFDLETLEESAKGCSVCAVIKDLVLSIYSDPEKRDQIRWLALVAPPYSGRSELRMDVWFPNHELEAFTIYTPRICTESTEVQTQTLLPMIKQLNHVQKDASSRVCLHLAREWYEECCANHDLCMTLESASSPTRLIAIEGDGDDWKIRLIEHPSPGTKYAALSHRWRQGILTTTTGNLSSMLQEILQSSLPRTFKDAIILCRYLDIPFLWIDSLCILQDDKTDWGYESAHMADIYQNACLVIAASAASEGMLVPRPDNFVNSRTFYDGENALEVCVAPLIWHYHEPGGQEPLVDRGWTLQERLLARRFLSFNKVEIHWECQMQSVCECSSGIASTRSGGRGKNLYNLVDMLKADDQDLSNHWHNGVLPRYSGRKLTEASDKLPAISAVARRFHARFDNRYLAGLWENSLLDGLSWHRYWLELAPKTDQIPSHYRAPSWSWASINSACSGPSKPSKEVARATVIDAQCNLATADEFGEVTSGFVTLRGPLVECWLTFPPDGRIPWHDVNLYIGIQETLRYECAFIPDSPLELTRSVNTGQYEYGVRRANFTYKNSKDYVDYSQPKEDGTFPRPHNAVKVWCLWVLEKDALVLGGSKDATNELTRLGICTKEYGDVEDRNLERLFENSAIGTVTII